MRTLLLTAAAAVVALPLSANAGCLTGALVGGAAGHLAGHGVLGAGAGCIVGHEHDKHAKQRAAQQANAASAANGNKPTPLGNGSSVNGQTNYVQPGN